MSTVPPLFRALVDDAAVFPPGNAAMPDAVRAHPEHRASWYGGLVGRFLCPVSRVAELRAALPAPGAGSAPPPGQPTGAPLEIGLVADTGLAGLPAAVRAVAADGRLALAGVAARLPDGAQRDWAERDWAERDWAERDWAERDWAERDWAEQEGWVAELASTVATPSAGRPVGVVVEVPRRPGWLDVLPVLASAGLGAKLRCGGLEPAAVPAPDEVADFVVSCVQQGVPFTCTAGLHSAVRHTDPATGVARHGFANVLAATVAAVAGAARPEVAAVLAVEEPGPLVAVLVGVDDEGARRARGCFTAYGSCSISEPVDDLLALGMVAKA